MTINPSGMKVTYLKVVETKIDGLLPLYYIF